MAYTVPQVSVNLTRAVRVLVSNRMTPAEIGTVIATKVRATLQELIDEGLASPVYQRFVDHIENAPEENVKLDGTGLIEYIFNRMPEAAVFAQSYAQTLSPIDSGQYWKSWVILVDGELFPSGDLTNLPMTAKNMAVVNFLPYARRLDPEFSRRPPRYHITDLTAQATQKRFRGLSVTRQFISLRAGPTSIYEVPYIRRTAPRREILYPAVIIEPPPPLG